MKSDYRALIASSRVSTGTRAALEKRETADDTDFVPTLFSGTEFVTLQALIEHVLPQRDSPRIDIAARLARQLESAMGDGWRAALLPPDAEAYRGGLQTLEHYARAAYGVPYAALADGQAHAILEAIASGIRVAHGPGSADAVLGVLQAQAWFADLRADVVRIFVAHPETLARLGYSGFANGGNGAPKSGFTRVGLGEREPWEPDVPAPVTT